MVWGKSYSFPRAIMHVDGDCFFASVEIARNPRLRGKPVITGKERGIVSACTYDVKKRGVTRGMRIHEARLLVPDAIVLPSDYETYSLFSERMYEIVRRYTPVVEEYSIDECFADLTGMRRVNRMNYHDMAHSIKRELEVELGMTFSVGLSATKVLAKIGSKYNKPDGFTAIALNEREKIMKSYPIESVWGIGPNTAAFLQGFGIRHAQDFARKDERWVQEKLPKPIYEIWQELNGTVAYELVTEKKTNYQSIQKTKTFTPPSKDEKFVFSQLSKNVENACIKARRWGLVSPLIFFFLKTQDFKYRGFEIKLPYPTNVPQDILREVAKYIPQLFKEGVLYRATGIALAKLSYSSAAQLDLFGKVMESQASKRVFESVDSISHRYGKHAVFLGSSFDAMRFGAHLGERGDAPERTRQLFKGETARRRLALPMLGEVN